MRMIRALHLTILLVGFCHIHHGLSTEGVPTSQESQLRMLSLGLAHLLHGVERNAEQLEQQGGQLAAELDGATRSLESLQKQSLQAGQTNRQVRRDLQIQSAQGDRLWVAVTELQRGLEDLETEQATMQQRMNQILQRVKSLTESWSGGQTQLDVSFIKVIMNKQAQQLATLTSVVSAQDRLINRRLQRIQLLEKQVSDSDLSSLRADSDSNCV